MENLTKFVRNSTSLTNEADIEARKRCNKTANEATENPYEIK